MYCNYIQAKSCKKFFELNPSHLVNGVVSAYNMDTKKYATPLTENSYKKYLFEKIKM
jgi:hypothetical protein